MYHTWSVWDTGGFAHPWCTVPFSECRWIEAPPPGMVSHGSSWAGSRNKECPSSWGKQEEEEQQQEQEQEQQQQQQDQEQEE